MKPVVQRRLRGAKANPDQTGYKETQKPRIRVAAYCRVSTSSDVQLGSLETQMKIFEQRIREHPGWELVNIYADEGISGTCVSRRKQFQRMIRDAESGKIDFIITKSLSRFARNTMECLKYVRELKSHGVYILFEKENIDTQSGMSEMLLTVMAAFAQEESRSISDHVKWGVRKRFEEGTPRWSKLYGYRLDEGGSYVIEEEEAAIIRRIFQMYLMGYSTREIGKALNDKGIPSPKGCKWENTTISMALSNERYAGDLVMQKYIRKSYLGGHSVANDETEIPSYLVEDHHEGIVSKEIYQKVQTVKQMRKQVTGQTSQYPYEHTEMRCPCCGRPLVLRRISVKTATLAWGCFENGGCGKFAIREKKLNALMAECYRVRWGEETPGKKDNRFFGVNYGWLSDKVKQISLTEENITVKWRDNTKTQKEVTYIRREKRPAEVARQYWKFLSGCPGGRYNPSLLVYPEKKEGNEDEYRQFEA